jgi:hypothetical protein
MMVVAVVALSFKVHRVYFGHEFHARTQRA